LSPTAKIEREVVVFSNWTIFGLVGLGFLLEGSTSDSFLVGTIGILAIIAGFSGHLIANHVFEQTFSKGEIALGLAVFALATLAFILTWLIAGLSQTTFLIGVATFFVTVVGLFVYLITRYGVGGAFRKFDVTSSAISGSRK
tara:strand:+ start:4761 stop:5186 length:426 start_codon:yes stop_codon:yes gene_type:complete